MTAYGGEELNIYLHSFLISEEIKMSCQLHTPAVSPPTHPRSKCLRFPLKRKLEGHSGKQKNICRESKLDILFVLPAACSVYLPHNYTDQNPSWEANSSAVSQENYSRFVESEGP